MKNKKILVTGAAGFIGSHLVEKLLADGNTVVGIDNFDPFYAKETKQKNLQTALKNPGFKFIEMDILDLDALRKLGDDFDAIVHLAAKAGIRPSILNPVAYQDVNVKGTQNMLEYAKEMQIKQFVFASSSSVYGINRHFPWKESDPVLNPISPYASTKISCELLGNVYSHLYGIRFIGLRFFTVYGPRQRPDLAIHLFSRKILNGEPINVFGDGSTRRDYTFVSDTVKGIYNAILYDKSNYEIFNLGNHQTVSLSDLISTIEDVFDKKALINEMPDQPGDVPITYADIEKAKTLLSYNPEVNIKQGVTLFKDWLLKENV